MPIHLQTVRCKKAECLRISNEIPFATFQTVDLADAMLTALLDDKAEFVELFLRNGLSMRDFLSPQILCQLYTGVSCPTDRKKI